MLVDINDIKLLLGIDELDTTKDNIINLMYNKSISYIQNYTGLKLEKQTIEKKYENNMQNILNLGYYPINSITELSVLIGTDFFDTNYEPLTDLVDYKLKPETGEIYIKLAYSGWQEYKATYVVGYDINDLPSDLNEVIIDYTVALYKENEKTDNFDGIKSTTTNGDSVSYMGKNEVINYVNETENKINLTLEKYKIVNY